MPLRYQRLILIIISMMFILSSALLILFNIKDNIVFFFTPSEIYEQKIYEKKKIRIGGFVKENSFKLNSNNTIEFIITDDNNDINVLYNGILPDLFRENQGVVAQGSLEKNVLKAKEVFAKHDENYMPASIVEQLKEKDKWNNKYK